MDAELSSGLAHLGDDEDECGRAGSSYAEAGRPATERIMIPRPDPESFAGVA